MAYELVYKIMEKGLPLPKHIFFSGRRVPQRSNLYKKITNKARAQFKEDIIKLGGIPEELLKFPNELDCLMDAIYKDIRLLESYTFVENRPLFDTDITVFYGKEDEKLDEKESEYWRGVTTQSCNIYGFDGDHFFIDKNADKIVSIFTDKLEN